MWHELQMLPLLRQLEHRSISQKRVLAAAQVRTMPLRAIGSVLPHKGTQFQCRPIIHGVGSVYGQFDDRALWSFRTDS